MTPLPPTTASNLTILGYIPTVRRELCRVSSVEDHPHPDRVVHLSILDGNGGWGVDETCLVAGTVFSICETRDKVVVDSFLVVVFVWGGGPSKGEVEDAWRRSLRAIARSATGCSVSDPDNLPTYR